MHISIIEPTRLHNFSAPWIRLQTRAGNIIIQEGHAPMVALLPAQELVITLASGAQELITIKSGCARIERNSITIIIS